MGGTSENKRGREMEFSKFVEEFKNELKAKAADADCWLFVSAEDLEAAKDDLRNEFQKLNMFEKDQFKRGSSPMINKDGVRVGSKVRKPGISDSAEYKAFVARFFKAF